MNKKFFFKKDTLFLFDCFLFFKFKLVEIKPKVFFIREENSQHQELISAIEIKTKKNIEINNIILNAIKKFYKAKFLLNIENTFFFYKGNLYKIENEKLIKKR